MPRIADLLERAAVDQLAQLRIALGQHQAPPPRAAPAAPAAPVQPVCGECGQRLPAPDTETAAPSHLGRLPALSNDGYKTRQEQT